MSPVLRKIQLGVDIAHALDGVPAHVAVPALIEQAVHLTRATAAGDEQARAILAAAVEGAFDPNWETQP